jgi:hypothetical protein
MRLALILLSVVASVICHSPKLAVLHAMENVRFPKRRTLLLQEAQRLDPAVDMRDVVSAQRFVTLQVTVSDWFHEVLVAANMVGASENDIYQSILTKRRSKGKPTDGLEEPLLRSAIGTWKKYCIERGACKSIPNSAHWMLTEDGILDFISSLIQTQSVNFRDVSEALRQEIALYVRANLHATPIRISEKFQVRLDKAAKIINEVIGIFRQPVWFFELLAESARVGLLSSESSVLRFTVAKLNKAHKTKVREPRNALRVWVPKVLEGRENFIFESEFVDGTEKKYARIRPEAISKHFKTAP